jgi:hypothetical protein
LSNYGDIVKDIDMGFLANLFKPKAETLPGVVNSIEELAKDLRTAINGDIPADMRADLLGKTLDITTKLIEVQSNVIIAEAQGHSWLQRNWRPITMICFLVLVILDSFAWLPNKLAPQAWTLLSIGLGGYVVGRSAEKVVDRLQTGSFSKN